MMQADLQTSLARAARRFIWLPAALALFTGSWAAGYDLPEDLVSDDHFREEMGVNTFTVPSIKKIFEDLQKLEPIPYEDLTRPMPAPPSADRLVLALNFGGLLADGFVYVQMEDDDMIEELARKLVRYCDTMGVGDRVKPHGKSLLERAFRSDWDGLKDELGETQKDVEYEMLMLRDQQIAHLVSLGGWLRAIEVASGAVAQSYDTERAAVLVRMELLDYFQENLSYLHPRLQEKPIVIDLKATLQKMEEVMARSGDAPPSESDVIQFYELSSKINAIIASPA